MRRTSLPKLSTVYSLGGRGLADALEMLMLTAFVNASFAIVGVSRTETWLRGWARTCQRRNTADNIRPEIQRLTAIQRAFARHEKTRGTCLSRSFVLWAILSRRGIHADLRVGFRKREGEFEGHAWLEYEGVPINESQLAVDTYSGAVGPVTFEKQKPA